MSIAASSRRRVLEGPDDGPPSAMPDRAAGDSAEKHAKGKIVDAAAGHQADKPAVEGDPKDEPSTS